MTNFLQHFRAWTQASEDAAHLTVLLNKTPNVLLIRWLGNELVGSYTFFSNLFCFFVTVPWYVNSCIPLLRSLVNSCLLTRASPSPASSPVLLSLHVCSLSSPHWICMSGVSTKGRKKKKNILYLGKPTYLFIVMCSFVGLMRNH